MFVWKALRDIVPVKEVLYKRRLTNDVLCPLCKMEEESVIHLFARCNFAQIVWHISPCRLDVGAIQGASLTEWWSNLLERWKGGKEDKSFWAAICSIIWRLWICRNDVVFNNHLERPDLVCQTTIREAAEFVTINAVDEQSGVAIQGDANGGGQAEVFSKLISTEDSIRMEAWVAWEWLSVIGKGSLSQQGLF